MKIIHLCPFSAGGCGVWARVKQESLEFLNKGHEVYVFSSNLLKDTSETVPSYQELEGIQIYRFPAKKLGGESFMKWLSKDAEQKIIELAPDVIVAHNYRHLHTTKALKIAKMIRRNKKCKVYLVTHAPFVEGNITRSRVSSLIVGFYDSFIARFSLNKFDKILAISHWEIPYLIKAGAKKSNIEYVPNGIPSLFFKQKKSRQENKIVFLGRTARKKKIETIIAALEKIKDKKIILEIVGPKDPEYHSELIGLVKKLALESRVFFLDPIYALEQKIKKIDSCSIFILASRVEGMPQSLIEAMAREKIVIGSNSMAIRDIIQDRKNGLLFEFDNSGDLAEKINLALKQDSAIQKRARKSVENFSWDQVFKKLEKIYSE